ncbi:HD-GYP domain, c-di-GMP phosphodiesterase class II (or its inactivated variant) [Marinospirillum celere]|uniref:HD-GYP domain, c-di-GMP phosphodiesterase class II (Or its inactivated variant) n=1 Tax=Marinospirillum celere TaxID=1122252 RepID=A0A1I1IC37_9GAMM|nr:HD family phosphohydrolase [Marinospirillum celere]SFC33581.1 HD-GYP domain, c-di-GMP phosphodiesterase class II (or its inactivated variant) [Marinospirillum celere]
MSSATPSNPSYERIRRLNAIGIALSAQNDQNQLLEMILGSARELTQADAGTLYMIEPDGESLRFVMVQNDKLNIHLGGSGAPVGDNFPLIPLHLEDGRPNERMIVAWSVLNKTTARIADAYHEEGFDFSGTRAFDEKTGYRSKSFLTVPLRNHEGEVIAALQLLNKLDSQGEPTEFDDSDQDIAESLASQAAIALTNRRLIDELRTLFDSFTQVIASAIDSKSAHTGAHCRRVPDATLMLAEAASGASFPGIEDFYMSEEDMYELKTAAWLHDCGKVVTPHHVMEKSTKLETIVDRIDWVTDRFEILRRDLEIERLKEELAAVRQGKELSPERLSYYQQADQQLADDLAFLQGANTGGEFMADELIARVEALGQTGWTDLKGDYHPLLNDDEVMNLSIRKGTLNAEERKIMEGHMVHTLNMLEQLPFPRHLQRVPEYAGGHHERMDGKGYPRGLTREQMSVPARIMGIADVFEALTAHERPYKKPMPLSLALTIMGRMVEDNHLDPDLYAAFVYKKVYLDYAKKHLREEQIDEVDVDNLPGLRLASVSQV